MCAEMAQDREHEQALQATADSLVGEQHALQKRLQQLRLHFGSDDEAVQQLRVGAMFAEGACCQ